MPSAFAGLAAIAACPAADLSLVTLLLPGPRAQDRGNRPCCSRWPGGAQS